MKRIDSPGVPNETGYYFAVDNGRSKKLLWFDKTEYDKFGVDSMCFTDSIPNSFGNYMKYAVYELECVFHESEESPKGVEEAQINKLYDVFANWYHDDGSHDTFFQSEAMKAINDYAASWQSQQPKKEELKSLCIELRDYFKKILEANADLRNDLVNINLKVVNIASEALLKADTLLK